MAQPDEVRLPMRVAGQSLTAAGLAAWVFAHAEEPALAERCGVIQALIDATLQQADETTVAVPRETADEAIGLWRRAAARLDAGAHVDPARPSRPADIEAATRLRKAATRIRRLMKAD